MYETSSETSEKQNHQQQNDSIFVKALFLLIIKSNILYFTTDTLEYY